MKKVRVLIVDDSAVIRNILTAQLRKYKDIEVIGTASDPYEARDMIVSMKPDVITLDIEMPKMNGIEFITVLMKHYPLPIIIISSLVSGKCETSLKCLELGAFEVVSKPASDIANKLPLMINELYQKIIAAGNAEIKNLITNEKPGKINVVRLSNISATEKIVVIGASTGGTKALEKILIRLPSNIPPVIISQHMPAGFTASFASRLNEICPLLNIKEAENDTVLKNGTVHIAPGNYHVILDNYGAKYKVKVKQGPKVSGHRPSVDVMFSSTAQVAGKNAVGIILTGMGSDGSEGLLEMFKAGAETIAQDEESSVVFGMPREAILKGAAKYVVHLDDIPETIVKLIEN